MRYTYDLSHCRRRGSNSQMLRKVCSMSACTSQEYPRPAPRPHNSCLQKLNLKLFGLSPMRTWDAALKEALSDSSFFKIP